MKVIILAGGLGSRLSEETGTKPKPMVEIGEFPILWHIMKIFSAYGHNDFLVCLGYKGYVIKEYFRNYMLHQSDVSFDFKNDSMLATNRRVEPWKVELVDTGENSMTGGRLGRLRERLNEEEDFFFTYGDGVADVNIDKLLAFHHSHGLPATVTATKPIARFGALEIDSSRRVTGFIEKPVGEGGYINGGFFVLKPSVFDLIENDTTVWEQEPMMTLAEQGQMAAYTHDGFWQPMDTIRDRAVLQELWDGGSAPWKVWND